MVDKLSASIIINNYNYERFLGEAIDSALNQEYEKIEVIVVDDGSTDGSRNIIKSYGNRILPVFKPNGGQASAFNAGFRQSSGDVIFFLDSDDVLYQSAVRNVLAMFTGENIAKVHWPLWVVNGQGYKTGVKKPPQNLPDGDFRDDILKNGPTNCLSSPTSGNAWSRIFLEKVFPVPEDISYYKTCADEYLYTLAPVFGLIKAIQQPQGFYRIHGRNIYSALSFKEKLKLELDGHTEQTIALSRILEKYGIKVDKDIWRSRSWFHLLSHAINDIASYLPQDETFILVDDDTWGAQEIYPNRTVIPFLECNGQYNGTPESDDIAIRELRRLLDSSVRFIVFAWPSFWWLEYYQEFHKHLLDNFNCILENERVVIFALKGAL